MKSARAAAGIVLMSALALPGCARKQPEAPLFCSLSGHVNLTGSLVDAGGRFAGTRVVRDADGVLVELMHGGALVGRTLTVKGVYRFAGLAPGDYVARIRVVADMGDDTNRMTIAHSDIAAADTIQVVSVGDIYPVPNPVGTSTALYFALSDTEQVNVRILDLGGNLVRPLYGGELLPGFRSLVWSGDDLTGQPATQPLYWATLVAGSDVRVQLLFR